MVTVWPGRRVYVAVEVGPGTIKIVEVGHPVV